MCVGVSGYLTRQAQQKNAQGHVIGRTSMEMQRIASAVQWIYFERGGSVEPALASAHPERDIYALFFGGQPAKEYLDHCSRWDVAGRLVDLWGSPYVFRWSKDRGALVLGRGGLLEIRSLGPNRILDGFAGDDLVVTQQLQFGSYPRGVQYDEKSGAPTR